MCTDMNWTMRETKNNGETEEREDGIVIIVSLD